MTQFNQPMTIHIHVHSNKNGGQPIVKVQDQGVGEDIRKEQVPSPTITEEMSKFYEDKYWRMIALRFSDYKGKSLEDMHPDEAAKAIAEIIDALHELPLPPDNYIETGYDIHAVWLVPEERAFCRLSGEELDMVYQHFMNAVSEIGISEPWVGDILVFEDLIPLPTEKYYEHVEKRAKLRTFDRMAGLMVTVRQR